MAIQISGEFSPLGNFPIVDDNHIRGGLMIVADSTARDAIPAGRRKAGMLVWTQDTESIYQLGAGLTNLDWETANIGGGLGKLRTLSIASGEVAIDASQSLNMEVSLTENVTIMNPTDSIAGQIAVLSLTQDLTGSRTVTFDTDWIALENYTTAANPEALSTTIVLAYAREVSSAIKWFYTIQHIAEPGVTELTGSGTLTVDATSGPKYSMVTITSDVTYADPTNEVAGQQVEILVRQDGTGGRKIDFVTSKLLGPKYQLALQPNAFTLLRGHARVVSSSLDWWWEIIHNEDTETTPTAVAANQTDWSPEGLKYAALIRASSAASVNLHGITAPASYEKSTFKIANVGSFNIVLKHQSGTESTAANRIITQTAGDLTVQPNDTVEFVYDRTTQRWRIW